ncbi:MAG: hypothetical protein HUU26_06105 [Gemmatimonadaceae bacterium]|nr:hypothetical protein [Gemmatimonadaceae bacterium]
MALSALARAQLDSAVRGRTARGVEDMVLRLEARLPGLGGLFVDTAGTLVAQLPVGRDTAGVRSALLDGLLIEPAYAELRARLATGMRVRSQATAFAFSTLVAGASLASQRLGSQDIVLVDADEANNRVRVGVAKPSGIEAATEALVALGLDRGMLQVELAPVTSLMVTLRQSFRPMGGGIQIQNANYGLCTVGFNVSNYMADTGFVTAGHCAPGEPGMGFLGPLYQPVNTPSTNQVANIELNPVWNVIDPQCGTYSICAKSDALYARYISPSAWAPKVAKTSSKGVNYGAGSITFASWWTSIPYVAGEYVGQSLEKVGRTTGWTGGTMITSCENVAVKLTVTDQYPHHVTLCAHRVSGSRVGGGDSGSPVFSRRASSIYPVGILFGGGSQNSQDWMPNEEGIPVCVGSGCTFVFSNWNYITTTHLGRQFDPRS